MWSTSFTYIDKSQIVGCSLPVLHQLIGIEFRGVVIFSWDRFHLAPVTRLAEQFCCSFSDRGASRCGRQSSGDGTLESGLSTGGNTLFRNDDKFLNISRKGAKSAKAILRNAAALCALCAFA
jgi:hypothetical protein